MEIPQEVLAMAREQQECEQAVEQLELQEQKEKEKEKEEEDMALDVGSGEKKMYDPAEEENSEET